MLTPPKDSDNYLTLTWKVLTLVLSEIGSYEQFWANEWHDLQQHDDDDDDINIGIDISLWNYNSKKFKPNRILKE